MISDISLGEVEETIKEAKNNKSPGLDGISYELYKKCKGTLAPILVDVFNAQLKESRLVE